MRHLHAGHQLEQLAGDVTGGADAARTHVDLAGIGLGVGDEFGNISRRHRRMNLHHHRRAHQDHHRNHVGAEVVAEIVVKRGVDRVDRVRHEQGVTVGRRTHGNLGTDVVSTAGTILDKKCLPQPLR